MNDKHALLKANPEVCKRLFGVKYDTFEILLEKVQTHFDTHLIENPISNRGLDGEFSTANQLLLTLEYLRQYPTFLIGPPMRFRFFLWYFRELCQQNLSQY